MGCFDLRPLMECQVAKSDVECLTEVADDLRSLYSEFGLRHRRVSLVWVGWTPDVDGDGVVSTQPVIRQGMSPDEIIEAIAEVDLDEEVVGVGRPVLLAEIELLPTPLVGSLAGISKDMDAMGLTERGGLVVSQISMRYSEDFLMGVIDPFRSEDPNLPDALRPGIDFWWEIQENRPAGFISPGYLGCTDAIHTRRQPRRRFHVSGTPEREPDRFQWSVELTRADGERGRDGEIDVVG